MAPLPEHLMPAPVGRSKLPREVREEHQRDRVVAAAIGVFAKRGYQGTTVDHIVAAARVGVGTFYALFDGKEDCFLRAYERIVGEAREHLIQEIDPDAPWQQQVCDGVESLLAHIAAEPLRARVALVEIQTAGPVGLARHGETLNGFVDPLRRGRSAAPVDVAGLPDTLEDATIGGIAWLLQQRVGRGEAAGVGVLLPELLEIVLEPYLGEDEAARIIAERSAGGGRPSPALPH